MVSNNCKLKQLSIPNSLWQATAPALTPQPELSGSHKTQVAIIGAGFTGCSTALHLAEQNVDVIVLDAGEVGIGASGRNGGQVNPGIKRTLDQVQKVWGRNMGKELFRVIGSAPDLVFDLVKMHDIDCHPVRTGIIQAAYSEKSMNYLRNYGEYQASVGAPVKILNRKQTSELVGSPYYLGGFLDRRAGSIQPLGYCRGLARAAMKAGAQFFSNTPVTHIDINAEKTLNTPCGTIQAEYVLICTNGYTNLVPNDPLIRKLSTTVIPFYSYLVATSPLSETLQLSVIPQEQVIADTRRLLTYFRKDPEGRLVMGGSGGPYEASGELSYTPIVQRILQIYPHLGTPQIQFRWCGKVCLTVDGLPHIHELSPGIFTGLGYNGRGVAMATLMGKWLAAIVTDIELDIPTIPITTARTIPLHNFRSPFLRSIQYVKGIQDRIERELYK